MLIVTGVGLCIFVFATGYMHEEDGYYRFFAYLNLFMFTTLAGSWNDLPDALRRLGRRRAVFVSADRLLL